MTFQDIERYILIFPFGIHPSLYIPIEDFTNSYQHNQISIELKEVGDYYILMARGFVSTVEAYEYADFLWVGFISVSLEHEIFFDFNVELEVKEIDGNLHGTLFRYSEFFASEGLKGPFIFKENGSPELFGTKHGFIRFGTDVQKMYGTIFEGKLFDGHKDILIDEKLKLALELYNAHAIERSPYTRFLLLVMGMEVLLPKSEKHNLVIRFLDTWITQLQATLDNTQSDSEEFDVLDSLKKDLDFRRYKSLRSSLKTLVEDTLQDHLPREEVRSLAKQALKVYDSRSQLVHNGKLSPSLLEEMEVWAREILNKILLVKVKLLMNK